MCTLVDSNFLLLWACLQLWNAMSTDFGVINKFQWVDELADTESANNEDELYIIHSIYAKYYANFNRSQK